MSDNTALFEDIVAAVPYDVRYSIKNLRTGQTFERDADVETPSASTRKVSILMAALKAVHGGRLDLAERITYEDRLREGVASGIFRYFQPGIVITLRDALVGMIALSDNICTKMVLERLSLEEVESFCRDLGMIGTHHRFLIPPPDLAPDHTTGAVTTTTAADLVLLLEAILSAQESEQAAVRLGCSRDLCRFAMQALQQQILRYGIASRLPYDTKFASKGGRGKRGRMDTGIVFREGRALYAIAVLTDGVPQVMPDGLPGYTSALETIGRLSRACWDVF